VLLVVDVLGRYSLEWTTRWDRTRWDYRMSFFATDVRRHLDPDDDLVRRGPRRDDRARRRRRGTARRTSRSSTARSPSGGTR
jgi:hypothetical protein